MVFFCRSVISAGGFGFVGEIAEPDFAAMVSDFSEPFLFTLAERDAPIARIGFRFVTPAVAGVLEVGGKTQVRPSIVEGIGIFVVNEQVRGSVAFDSAQAEHNLPVHKDGFEPACFGTDDAACVRDVVPAAGKPVEGIEQIEIVGFDNSEFAFSQSYFAEGIAESQAAIF